MKCTKEIREITKIGGKEKMPLCGFNQEMLKGMDKFHEGLVEAIADKESLDLERKE